MKKHPAIKFILITVVSGICGAVLSFLLSFQQAALVSACLLYTSDAADE